MSGKDKPDYQRLADIWHGIMNTEPFRSPQLGEWLRLDVDSDRMPQPGFVGRHYRTGGTLLLGMNPGRITEKRETEAEQRFYAALGKMRQGIPDRISAFKHLNEVTEEVATTWRFHRVLVAPVLAALGVAWSQVTYLNLLKWRSRGKAKLTALYNWSWENHTSAQIRAISPGRVVVLGVGAGRLFEAKAGARACKVIPRTRGDSYISEAAHRAIEELRQVVEMSALMTEDYLEALTRQGDREAFDRVLAKVPSVPPNSWDRWDEETPSEDEPTEAELGNGSKTRRS